MSPGNASGKWLDYEANRVTDGAVAVIFSTPPVGHSQIWCLVDLGDGIYRISPEGAPDAALTVTNPPHYDPYSGKPSANLCKLYKYAGVAAQQWTLVQTTPHAFHVKSCFDGNYLNVSDNESAEGQQIVEWPPQNNNNVNDLWSFVPVAPAQ